MALEIVWSKRAENGYDKILRHLEEEWTEREIRNFINETRQFLSLLEKNPHLLEPSQVRKNIYRGPMNRLTIVTYRVKPRIKLIELLNVRSSRQRPLRK
ncbi:type II toxin-antitoxin system RelE/ParE family toxin [Geofilum rubicundum]|uniref:type II toxin-antitoxin system RelE/ParE family toxin n=1 Tax=Geofilum rubicundum TaxID=472113 RepID=UPI0009FC9969